MHAATPAGGIYIRYVVVSNCHCDAVGTCESDQQRMFNTLFFNFCSKLLHIMKNNITLEHIDYFTKQIKYEIINFPIN